MLMENLAAQSRPCMWDMNVPPGSAVSTEGGWLAPLRDIKRLARMGRRWLPRQAAICGAYGAVTGISVADARQNVSGLAAAPIYFCEIPEVSLGETASGALLYKHAVSHAI